MTEAWQRHDLLRVDEQGWRRALCSRPDLAGVDLLSHWAQNGWPVMVRRYLASDAPEHIPIAVALPRAGGNPSVALQIRAQDVMSGLAPLPLQRAARAAPVSWSATLQRLHTMGAGLGSVPAVYGSLLWQCLTGLTYLHERSDLDLIWRVSDATQAQQLAAAIDACAAQGPMPIDGEFIAAAGVAVNWREFHQCRSQVLVKTLHGVQMFERARLFRANVELADGP